MPRAMWSGSISFGLVTIPVKLYVAVSRKTVHFNQLDRESGSRIRMKKVSAETGDEVPSDRIIKGYELASGQYVVVDEAELGALDPVAQRTIDIEEFVDLADIDPVFYDSAYYLAPDKAAVKPYALLARAMDDAGKVGIARFVMRTKQYLAAIRPKDGRLLLSTMVYADELVAPEEIPEIGEIGAVELPERELEMAQMLIDSLAGVFEPEKYRDTHREAVLELIERKAAGEELVVAAAAPEAERVVDLMAALEASVKAAKESRKRHPTGRSGADESDEGADDVADAAKSA